MFCPFEKISDLEGEVDDLVDEISSLQDDLKEANDTISDLENDLGDARNEVEALEDEIIVYRGSASDIGALVHDLWLLSLNESAKPIIDDINTIKEKLEELAEAFKC